MARPAGGEPTGARRRFTPFSRNASKTLAQASADALARGEQRMRRPRVVLAQALPEWAKPAPAAHPVAAQLFSLLPKFPGEWQVKEINGNNDFNGVHYTVKLRVVPTHPVPELTAGLIQPDHYAGALGFPRDDRYTVRSMSMGRITS